MFATNRTPLNTSSPPADLAAEPAELIGRVGELAEIDRFLDSVSTGLHALLLSGQAGIGKTTLWKATVDRAARRGIRVLASRPTEVETQLSFGALVDLLDPDADRLLARLPEPQRDALAAALLRAAPAAAPSPLAVSLGVLGAIRAAAESGPVLIAIDDVPWLDASSSRALEYAVRRLEDAPVLVVAARRSDVATSPPVPLIEAIAPERRSTIDVGTLSLNDMTSLISQALGVDLRRPVLVRIHELSAGNAFYALEMARALARRGDREFRADAPLPDSLDALIHDRIEGLSPTALDVALHAAALSAPTRAVLELVLGNDRVSAGIVEVQAAGILESGDAAPRFTHPLLAAAIYRRASAAHRLEVHRALAGAVVDAEERARHLALSVDVPDAGVAAVLDDAARLARSRGAAAAAADLAEAAVRLTPADDAVDRRRRILDAADHHVTAGDVPLARSTLERGLADIAPHDRGPILAQLGLVMIFLGEMEAARSAFEAALPLAGDDLGLRSRVHMGIAGVAFLTGQIDAKGEQHITTALADAEALGEPTLILQAIGHFATWQFYLGRGMPPELQERAASLEAWRPNVVTLEHPDLQFAHNYRRLGKFAAARPLVERLLADARERGDWSSQSFLHDALVIIETGAGRWDVAMRHAADSRVAALQSGQEQSVIDGGVARVHLLALQGDEATARSEGHRHLAAANARNLVQVRRGLMASLALLELSLGNATAAYAQLEPILAELPPYSADPTLLRPAVPLAVECLVGLGRLDEAEVVLQPYDDLARRTGRAAAIADVALCRALVSAGRQDLDAAVRWALEAVQEFSALEDPFDAAHASLVQGEILRRARKKAEGREAVRSALATFERLGAVLWADRARAELGRSGSRRSEQGSLTETQSRVAELAAGGKTNREIADSLFMSVHTVETHLTQIYRTLEIENRTELARRWGDLAPG